MNSRLLPIAIIASLALAGCAQTHTGSLEVIDPADFGEANRQTYAAMVVDPDPQYDGPMEGSAEHAADAIERYREGNVEEPESVRTTSGSGGGSGS
jgi:hypothetical protein